LNRFVKKKQLALLKVHNIEYACVPDQPYQINFLCTYYFIYYMARNVPTWPGTTYLSYSSSWLSGSSWENFTP